MCCKDEFFLGKPFVGLRKTLFNRHRKTRDVMRAHAVVGVINRRDKTTVH